MNEMLEGVESYEAGGFCDRADFSIHSELAENNHLSFTPAYSLSACRLVTGVKKKEGARPETDSLLFFLNL